MAQDISLPDVSKLNDLKDDQIEALIEKLAEVQAHAPQIIAALEAQQESRSRGSKSKGSKGDRKGNSDRGERTQPPKQRSPQQHQVQEVEEEEEDDDDEDYDDFDEDAEYPMVGEGYSDELSVVSDMTTPTVVSSLEINEEEYYRDINMGAGMKLNAPKKKDLLTQVAKTNARKAPGATMAKKKAAAVADTALKKPSRAASMHSTRPEKVTGAVKSGETKKKKSKDGSSTPTGTKKVKKKTVKKKVASPNNTGSGWDATNGGGPSTGAKKKGPQEKAAPVMIDDDGFLVDQSTFETFDTSNNFFAQTPSFTADGADDGFGAFADFGTAEPAPKKSSKPKKLNVSSTGKKKNSSSSSQTGGSPKTKRKGTRRQSLGA